jgi:antitoxin component YwqK of YwqJK toxin-antitoxin module
LWMGGVAGCGGGGGGMDAGDKGAKEGLEIHFEELEFRSGLWYSSGSDVPFSGTAVGYHPNGSKAWATVLEGGVPKGRVLEWDPEGRPVWP